MNTLRFQVSGFRFRRAFTLIEMLVVIGIVAILIALLIPALSAIEDHANRTKCRSNVHQGAVGAVAYFDEAGDYLPSRMSAGDPKWGEMCEQLLPYVKNVIEVFDCPANPDINATDSDCKFPSYDKYTDYELNGFLSNPPGGRNRQSGIKDYSKAAYMYDYPFNSAINPIRAHENGINVGYLDGHAAWVPDEDLNLSQVSNEFYKAGHTF